VQEGAVMTGGAICPRPVQMLARILPASREVK
jgi:hypothetical protein